MAAERKTAFTHKVNFPDWETVVNPVADLPQGVHVVVVLGGENQVEVHGVAGDEQPYRGQIYRKLLFPPGNTDQAGFYMLASPAEAEFLRRENGSSPIADWSPENIGSFSFVGSTASLNLLHQRGEL